MTTQFTGGRSAPTSPRRGLLRILRRPGGPKPTPSEDVAPLDGGAPGEPERPHVRKATVLFHVILSAALWVTYLLYWRVVLARGVGLEAIVSLGVLALFALSIYGGMRLWVAHNRRLARSVEGRRTERAPAGDPPPEDFLGRRLEIPSGDAIKLATRIVIQVEGNTKHFRAENPVRAETEVVQESVC